MKNSNLDFSRIAFVSVTKKELLDWIKDYQAGILCLTEEQMKRLQAHLITISTKLVIFPREPEDNTTQISKELYDEVKSRYVI